MYVIYNPGIGYFLRIDDEHFVAQYVTDKYQARRFLNYQAAADYLNEWKDAGVGLNGTPTYYR